MKLQLSYATVLTLLALIFPANHLLADTATLKTTSYNFQLDSDGGGASALLNGVSVEVYCDNFGNLISVPHTYTVDVTDLSTSANLDDTRFGGLSAGDWVNINLSGTGSTVTQDDTFFNSGAGSNALARYEMAAYLTSQYDLSKGANTANSDLQLAIWALMDPKANSMSISSNKVTTDLESAANWYTTMNVTGNLGALNTFLNQFEVLSDPSMTYGANGLGNGGFQEQFVMMPAAPTPEPRAGIFMVFGLFIGGCFLWRRSRPAASPVHAAN